MSGDGGVGESRPVRSAGGGQGVLPSGDGAADTDVRAEHGVECVQSAGQPDGGGGGRGADGVRGDCESVAVCVQSVRVWRAVGRGHLLDAVCGCAGHGRGAALLPGEAGAGGGDLRVCAGAAEGVSGGADRAVSAWGGASGGAGRDAGAVSGVSVGDGVGVAGICAVDDVREHAARAG